MTTFPTRRRGPAGLLARRALWCALALGALPRDGAAQTCFAYVDSQPTLAPITCVDKTDLTTPCSYGNLNSPTDCTTVPAAPGSQTVLEMHTLWHECFGPVGGNVPPAGRSQRWYAFHRQFEHDFNLWRRANGFDPIESLEWCPDMNLPVGTGPQLNLGDHPSDCGLGTPRPPNVACPACIAFPQCLFLPGGGPMDCPGAPSTNCQGGGVSFSYDSLDEFANVDEVAKILDAQFHGQMHGAVAFADRLTCDPDNPTPATCYNLDALFSDCSPRDPMFWRLHKALDDVVRAWQDAKAVDVVLVIDRSGSMTEPDAGGGTKWEAALTAVDNFADLLEDERDDNQTNRIGIVSFSNTASIDLPMTDVDATLRDPGGPFDTAVDALTAAGPGGCTGIGAGLQKALELLCPPGDCQGFSANGDNDRKGILLLTDGVENQPPCLQPAGAAGAGCGTQCFGPQLDYDKLEFTQVVTVGFGNAGSLNGDLLTLLAERQGGIYLHDPNLPDTDLKDYYTKAFGQLTDEFLLIDPRGLLTVTKAATPPVEYPTCGDRRLTFASGWQTAVAAGQMRLLVNTPAGNLVQGPAAGVETSLEDTWEFDRIDLPHLGENAGTWRAQLVRPHRVYVNGFAPDALAGADAAAGVTLVRRQIQRLCPEGCARVLYYEAGRLGTSAYRSAIDREIATGLLGAATTAADAAAFTTQLGATWDLIVYSRMGAAAAEPYDSLLASKICQGQRAILTDPRPQADQILACAGMARDGSTNWKTFQGDDRLFAGTLTLDNPGHAVVSYGVRASTTQPIVDVQATANAGANGAVAARFTAGLPQHWYMNVLGLGLSKLDVYHRALDQRTGDDLWAMARMLPSYIPAGGFDSVQARVEVEYPLVGLGTMITQQYSPAPKSVGGEVLDRRAVTAERLVIPTGTATFPLFDDGTHGDVHPRNAYWTGRLTGLGAKDGTYRLRYLFDLTKNGCTTRRELAHSTFVDVRVSREASEFRVVDQRRRPDGGLRTTVRLRPADNFGNLWGPGRAEIGACEPVRACTIDRDSVVDAGDGSYSLAVDSMPGLPGVRLTLMGTVFDLPLPCTGCPRLSSLSLGATRTKEHSFLAGKVRLGAPAPAEGAVVFLESSNREAATVPERVVVPAGASEVEFEVAVLHAHGGPSPTTVTARYGASESSATLTVMPLGPTAPSPGEPPAIPVKVPHGGHGGHGHGAPPKPAYPDKQ